MGLTSLSLTPTQPTTHLVPGNGTQARDALCQRIQKADKLPVPKARIEQYDSILSTEGLEQLLTSEEIGNIFWNKGLDHSKLADAYYNGDINERQQLASAVSHQELSIENIEKAKSLFDKTEDITEADKTLTHLNQSLEKIMQQLEQSTATIPDYQEIVDTMAAHRIEEQLAIVKLRHRFFALETNKSAEPAENTKEQNTDTLETKKSLQVDSNESENKRRKF